MKTKCEYYGLYYIYSMKYIQSLRVVNIIVCMYRILNLFQKNKTNNFHAFHDMSSLINLREKERRDVSRRME